MASQVGISQGQNGTTKPRPNKGDILIVIHDFVARGDDELTLKRGDRVRLTERDDDFGDGWYLGEHLGNGTSGLFPEVYTQLPQPSTSTLASASQARTPIATAPTTAVLPTPNPSEAVKHGSLVQQQNETSRPTITSSANIHPQQNRSSAPEQQPMIHSNSATRLSAGRSDINKQPSLPSLPPPNAALPGLPKKVAGTSTGPLSPDSAVMNETLSVINEHITDMKGVRRRGSMERKLTNETISEYGNHVEHHRLSYINGEETDEEEEVMPTRAEVLSWSPDQVAEYLFTVGVEPKHCDVLRSEEFSGEVILGMEQEALQMASLDLGSIGRRLKTWHKIKALQDGVAALTRRNTGNYGSEHGSDNASRRGSRNTTTSMPRIPSLMERPGSRQNTSRYSQQQNLRSLDGLGDSPISPMGTRASPQLGGGENRPSAAIVRDMQHLRQNSGGVASGFVPLKHSDQGSMASSTKHDPQAAHRKNPSFDRNWTMGDAGSTAPMIPVRPVSSGLNIGTHFLTEEPLYRNDNGPGSDLDRGYFSGGEAESRNRGLFKKRTSNSHARNSSYTEEQRTRTATTNIRHSRIGSVDSMREKPVSAAQKYYGTNGKRRTPSESSINPTLRPMPPMKDVETPPITRLEGMPYPDSASAKSPASLTPQNGPADWSVSSKSTATSRFGGLRAISDAVTGHERSKLKTPTDHSAPGSSRDSPLQSPSRAGTEGSSPSGEPSFDLGSPDAKLGSSQSGPTRTRRKKSKKETSAYTRGLLPLSFADQKDGADYYGWMKKKSSNLMTTWKWRLCILKQRRLSYYYSEEDTEEKGLIDISFHRVLPADGDKVTNLHATLTGATNGPTSPPNTIAPSIASALSPNAIPAKNQDGEPMFIFKLVPPRAGLSRAVTFTKPTVHYFAVQNVQQGRLWMAALMKATIDRDDNTPITTTYQQKTISLSKAQMMRHRPPALMNLEENPGDETLKTPASDKSGLNISGVTYENKNMNEEDSGVSGFTRPDTNTELKKVDSAIVEPAEDGQKLAAGVPVTSPAQTT